MDRYSDILAALALWRSLLSQETRNHLSEHDTDALSHAIWEALQPPAEGPGDGP